MSELLYKDEVYAIVGAAIEVHRELGSGFLEAVYQEALEIEMQDRGIPHHPQKQLRVYYKNRMPKKFYVTDFACYDDRFMVEIKAEKCLTALDEAQLLNQLKATKVRVGLLINFGSTGKLEWKRYIY